MNNLTQIVDILESNLSILLSKHEDLKRENEELKRKKKDLEQQVSSHQQLISDLNEQYESLKIANAIVGSKEEKHLTKLKINTLIREIDKCIVQLSE